MDWRFHRPIYFISKIPKRSGKFRYIEIPDKKTKEIQRMLLIKYLNKVNLAFSCHGFRKNHSVVTNAIPHENAAILIKEDIQDFFQNIEIGLIYKFLKKELKQLKISKYDLKYLIKIATYRGRLPTGAPTSPIIANIVMKEFDNVMEQYAYNRGFIYTRYADDMTFSSLTKKSKHEIKNLRSIITNNLHRYASYSLSINEEKSKIFTKRQSLHVTGININKNLSITKKYRDNIKAAIHQAKTTKDLENISGRISWVEQVNKEAADKLRKKLKEKEAVIKDG